MQLGPTERLTLKTGRAVPVFKSSRYALPKRLRVQPATMGLDFEMNEGKLRVNDVWFAVNTVRLPLAEVPSKGFAKRSSEELKEDFMAYVYALVPAGTEGKGMMSLPVELLFYKEQLRRGGLREYLFGY